MKSEYAVLRSGSLSFATTDQYAKTPAVVTCPNYGGRDHAHANVGFRVALFVR